jgi:predicted nucleic acid-binding protein
VLAYKEGVGFALECAKKIISNQRTVLYRLEGDEEARIFELAGKISKKLSYVDYSIIYLARKHNHRVLTFDRQLSALVG